MDGLERAARTGPSGDSTPHRDRRKGPGPIQLGGAAATWLPAKRASLDEPAAMALWRCSSNTNARQIVGIDDWLDQVKRGYSTRFAASFKEIGGYHDLDDLMYDATELSLDGALMAEMLTPAGAKPLDLRRIAGAIKSQDLARQYTGFFEVLKSPMFEPRECSSICKHLVHHLHPLRAPCTVLRLEATRSLCAPRPPTPLDATRCPCAFLC